MAAGKEARLAGATKSASRRPVYLRERGKRSIEGLPAANGVPAQNSRIARSVTGSALEISGAAAGFGIYEMFGCRKQFGPTIHW